MFYYLAKTKRSRSPTVRAPSNFDFLPRKKKMAMKMFTAHIIIYYVGRRELYRKMLWYHIGTKSVSPKRPTAEWRRATIKKNVCEMYVIHFTLRAQVPQFATVPFIRPVCFSILNVHFARVRLRFEMHLLQWIVHITPFYWKDLPFEHQQQKRISLLYTFIIQIVYKTGFAFLKSGKMSENSPQNVIILLIWAWAYTYIFIYDLLSVIVIKL